MRTVYTRLGVLQFLRKPFWTSFIDNVWLWCTLIYRDFSCYEMLLQTL